MHTANTIQQGVCRINGNNYTAVPPLATRFAEMSRGEWCIVMCAYYNNNNILNHYKNGSLGLC